MDTIGFNKVLDLFRMQREARCINTSGDMVIVVSGDEGSGKSMFSLALGAIDPNFGGQQIYYQWREYVLAQLQALKAKVKDMPPDLIAKYNVYDITEEDLEIEGKSVLGPGSLLVYDEAGTQLHSRSSMSKANIDQIKLFISNRFLNFIHVLNVPKPASLDKYVRQERIKYFCWVDSKFVNNMTKQIRTVYLWSKESYMKIFEQPYWWNLFNNPGLLITKCKPDFRCQLPNLVTNNYIPENLIKEYNTKKALFNLRQLSEMGKAPEEQGNGKKENNQYVDKWVKEGEDKVAWCKRTGLSPGSYRRYQTHTQTT